VPVFSVNKSINEKARAIVLTSEQWFLLSGNENTDGGLIINPNEMQKTPGLYQSKETSTICTSSNSLHIICLLFVEVDSLSILHRPTLHMLFGLEEDNVFFSWLIRSQPYLTV
jgi:hypothetical protein